MRVYLSPRGARRRTLLLAAAASLAIAAVGVSASPVAATTYPQITVYQDAHYGGQSHTFLLLCNDAGVCYFGAQGGDEENFSNIGGPCWPLIGPLFGSWNDCVSSIYIWNQTYEQFCVYGYNNINHTGSSQLWVVPARSARSWPHVTYNDQMSSIDAMTCG